MRTPGEAMASGTGVSAATAAHSSASSRPASAARAAAVYELHGLRLRSDLPLGARRTRSTAPDLSVERGKRREIRRVKLDGELLADVRWPGGQGYTVTHGSRGYVLQFDGICEFRFGEDWRAGRVDLDPAADERLVSLLLSGNVLAWYLTLTGEPPLHASAVQFSGGALAFAGGSGAGKSTLAALCCAGGGRLVTDDLLRLRIGAEVCVHRGTGELRLRAGAASLAESLACARRDRSVDNRLTLRLPGDGDASPPLRAIVLPRPSRAATTLQVRRLAAARALFLLNGCSRINGWQHPRTLSAIFHWYRNVVRSVPVFEAEIPWGPPFAPALVEALLGRVGIAP